MTSWIVLTGAGSSSRPGIRHIPLHEKMAVRISQYTGQKFMPTMPETGNQNLHHTLFFQKLVFAGDAARLGTD